MNGALRVDCEVFVVFVTCSWVGTVEDLSTSTFEPSRHARYIIRDQHTDCTSQTPGKNLHRVRKLTKSGLFDTCLIDMTSVDARQKAIKQYGAQQPPSGQYSCSYGVLFDKTANECERAQAASAAVIQPTCGAHLWSVQRLMSMTCLLISFISGSAQRDTEGCQTSKKGGWQSRSQ